MLRALIVLALATDPCRAAEVSLAPPPGWRDVTASRKAGNVLVSMKGPGSSSFVLTRVAPLAMENRAVARAFLLEVLKGIEARSKLGLRPAGNIETITFADGLTAYCLLGEIGEKPGLILALTQREGDCLLGTLVSAAPRTLLPSFMGSIRTGSLLKPRAVLESLDGQLSFALPAGVSARALDSGERKRGLVAAFRGLGSELLLMKIMEEDAEVRRQADIVEATALAAQGARPETLVPAAKKATPAGPDLVFASVKLREASGGESAFIAAYMPWGYWGYSALARGPRALELIASVFEKISLGPAAVPRLVASTQKVPLARGRGLGARLAAVALLLAGAFFLLWRKRAK